MSKTILVAGATGNQGGATVRALVALNGGLASPKYTVLALTRDATSDKAKALAALPNVKLVQGDLADSDKIFASAGEKVYGAFLAQTIYPEEEPQAYAFFEAAQKHEVQQIVYSNADFAGLPELPLPFFEAKRRIEQRLLSSAIAVPYKTVLGPTGFMENLFWDALRGQVMTTWNPALKYKYIAVEDIGRVAAQVFERAEELNGRKLNLAGDSLTPAETEQVWKEVTGKSTRVDPTPELPAPIAGAYDVFFNKTPFEAEPAEVRKLFPFVLDLKTWLAKSDLSTPSGHPLDKKA